MSFLTGLKGLDVGIYHIKKLKRIKIFPLKPHSYMEERTTFG